MRIARDAAAVYLGVVILLYWFQTRVIFPGADTQGQPSSQVRPQPGTELVRLETRQGDQIVALFGPALNADGKPHPGALERPTLIFFYGNGMCLDGTLDLIDRFRRLGLNVIVPDYVGYGMSSGSPSEKGCRATADAVYDHVVSTLKVDQTRIIAGGWSLGGAVAIDLASRRQVSGLIAFSTFTSMVDMARRAVPFVPVSLLLQHRFESAKKIATIECPTLIGHGRADRVVPFRFGEKLAACAAGPLTTVWIDGADHGLFHGAGGAQFDRAIADFVTRYFP